MRATRTLSSLAAALALIALAAGPAVAKKLGGVTMVDHITVDGHRLVLNGMGLREATIFKVDVYVAGLYLPRSTSDPAAILGADEPRRLHLVFVRDVDRGDITKAWSKGFRNNVDKKTLAAIDLRVSQLNGWMKKMRDGDSLTFTYVPGSGTAVEINGRRAGVIEGRDFGRALFAIWLGPKPPNSKLKKGLLGR